MTKHFSLFTIVFFIKILVVQAQVDVAGPYVLREIQISSAKAYLSQLKKSTKQFTEYSLSRIATHEATKTNQKRPSTLLFVPKPERSCITKWGPLKIARCYKKVKLLQQADIIVRSVSLVPTSNPINSEVSNKIMVKTNSILKGIKTELINN